MTMQNETNPVSHRWANIPGLDNKAQVSASRAQGRIKGMLREQKADIALIRLENLKIPPRRSVVTYWSYRDNSYAQIGARPDDCQNVVEMDVGLDMVPIAIDLYRRWPEKERPQSIVLLSDGQTLLFNPGRPESEDPKYWVECYEGEAPYYVHVETGESQWEPPPQGSW